MKELIEKIRDELSDGGVMVAPYWAELLKDSADAIESQAATIALYETTAENCDVLRAKVAEQAREIERRIEFSQALAKDAAKLDDEIAAMKAQPRLVLLPERAMAGNDQAYLYVSGRNHAIEEMTRLNSSLVSGSEPVYQFQYREIGEGGWSACDHDWYMHCQKSPEHDTRVVQTGASAGRVDERSAFDEWFCKRHSYKPGTDTTQLSAAFEPFKAWQARAALAGSKGGDL